MTKEYLGDSVYIELNSNGQLQLTTENGLPNDPSNIIILEPEVLGNLMNFIMKRFRRIDG